MKYCFIKLPKQNNLSTIIDGGSIFYCIIHNIVKYLIVYINKILN